jgi:hypothetical protein
VRIAAATPGETTPKAATGSPSGSMKPVTAPTTQKGTDSMKTSATKPAIGLRDDILTRSLVGSATRHADIRSGRR